MNDPYHMTRPPPLPRPSWDDLRLFAEIARTGTLTAAARRLKLSQPTAGRRLRALEEAIGAPLFQRTPSGFLLTGEGEVVQAHALRMEEEAVALERRLLGGARGLEGVLRLSASDWFSARILGPALARFAGDHPGITIELIADFRLLDLQRREADLVFRFVPFVEADVVQRRFTTVRYYAYASPGYLERHGNPQASRDGEGHRIIMLDSALDSSLDVHWLRGRWPSASLSLRSNNRDTQAAACAAGAGIAVLPRAIGNAQPDLVLLGGEEPPHREIWVGYHQDLKRLRRLRALLDHLAAAVPDEV